MADLQDEPPSAGIGAPDLQAPAGPETTASALERAAALLSVHPVADGCNTLVWTLRQSPYHDIETPDAGVDTDIPRLRAGGVGAQFWSLLVPPGARPPEDGAAGDRVVCDTLEQIDAALTLVRRYPESLRLALSADDMADARNRGRIASFLGPVPGRALTGSLGALRAFHALGVRALAPAGAPWAQEALTAFGHEVVQEANRLAILLDLAGCEPAVARQLAGASKAPVIISNTAAAALNPHPHNVCDEVLALLRETNGLAMVTFDTARTGDSLHAVADHLDHVRAVAGPEGVGLGAAFGTEPPGHRPTGLTDPSGYPRLIAELLDRGWPESDLALLTWGNAQRVIRDAEFTARRRPSPAGV
ncbi:MULTISPECIES: membrane dipeptidase [unclassified Streptomyces]|uniref:membrane dipeptidase n=1 Tax=unclassified Streptomyces TaxID=2593676 RepID=UPI00055B8152|nr:MULTISPECIES: membrane dipeptidase [unclassified Streptomyces]AQT72785.1 dipeptidase [Streptomyces sp. fd1-xmd]